MLMNQIISQLSKNSLQLKLATCSSCGCKAGVRRRVGSRGWSNYLFCCWPILAKHILAYSIYVDIIHATGVILTNKFTYKNGHEVEVIISSFADQSSQNIIWCIIFHWTMNTCTCRYHKLNSDIDTKIK